MSSVLDMISAVNLWSPLIQSQTALCFFFPSQTDVDGLADYSELKVKKKHGKLIRTCPRYMA